MAIALIARGSINSSLDATSYASGSFTPTANSLLVAIYDSDRTSADPTTPTVSGHGTWTAIDSLAWATLTDITAHGKLFIFALKASATPSASAVTFDHAGVTHHGAEASIFELSGTDVVNGVAQCFVQLVHSPVDDAGGSSSLAITLAAGSASQNRPFMAVASLGATLPTAQTNWTEIHELNHSTPDQALYTEYRTNAFDTAAFVDYSGNVRRGGIAFEIKAALSQTVTVTSLIDQSGVLYAPQANRRLASRAAFQTGAFQPDTFFIATGSAYQYDAFQDDTFQFAHDTHFFVDQTYQIFAPVMNITISLGDEAGFEDDSFQNDAFQSVGGFLNYAGGTFAPVVFGEEATGDKTRYMPLIDQEPVLYDPSATSIITAPLIDQSGVLFAPVGAPQAVSFGSEVLWDDPNILWDQLGIYWDEGGTGGVPIDQSGELFDPLIGMVIAPDLIDQEGVVYAPQVAGQYVLTPLIDQEGVLYLHLTNQTGIAIPLIDQSGELFAPSTNATTAPLIDQTGVLYAPQINLQNVSAPLIDQSFESGGAVYPPQVNFTLTFGLIDQSGELFAPGVNVILPGIIDQSGVLFTPVLGYVAIPLIDQSGELFAPDHITIPTTQTVRLDESDAQFIDQSGVMYDPADISLAPPQTIFPTPLIDQEPVLYAPFVRQVTKPLIAKTGRYHPTINKTGRYHPTITKRGLFIS